MVRTPATANCSTTQISALQPDRRAAVQRVLSLHLRTIFIIGGNKGETVTVPPSAFKHSEDNRPVYIHGNESGFNNSALNEAILKKTAEYYLDDHDDDPNHRNPADGSLYKMPGQSIFILDGPSFHKMSAITLEWFYLRGFWIV
jgi:hypothetical protein